MKLATRLSLHAALAVLPLLGVIAYSIHRLQDLAIGNERLVWREFVGSRVAADVLPRLDRLEEYQRKYSVSRDLGYSRKFADIVDAIDAELAELHAAQLPTAERAALDDLLQQWNGFARSAPQLLDDGDVAALSTAIDEIVARSTEVRVRTRDAARGEIRSASEAREAVQHTALVVAGIALALSLGLILLTVRSLRRRMDDFRVGTQLVSQGALSFKLESGARDELGEVAQSFNKMVEALRQLERMKQDFISSVSHELRTPLVAMLETNQFLLDEVPGPLTAQQRRMLRLNTQAAQRLSAMISDLLDLSRLKAGIRYEFAVHDLSALTRNSVSEFEATARERGVRLAVKTPSDPLWVSTDPGRYAQVVQNLVENAIRYGSPGDRVEVRLRSESVDALELAQKPLTPTQRVGLLSIDDEGPGVPNADRERIFEKFFRRHGQPSDGGVGLGLAISREIVAAHDGRIWVQDGHLTGASFRVALPLLGRKGKENSA